MLIGRVSEFDLWLAYGMNQGWVSDPKCISHSEIPVRNWEQMEFDVGMDPCLLVLRLWEDGMPDDDDEINEPSPEVQGEGS